MRDFPQSTMIYYIYCMQIPQLNILRFIAAMGVVVFHFGQKFFPFTTYPFSELAKHGGLCVGFFFALSGFILTVVYFSSAHNNSLSIKEGDYRNKFVFSMN